MHTPGDLNINIEGSGDPFQLQISTSLVNDILEVILGLNNVEIDVSYSQFKNYGFPLDFTSTTLDSAVPGLTDVIGYDLKLSARFVN